MIWGSMNTRFAFRLSALSVCLILTFGASPANAINGGKTTSAAMYDFIARIQVQLDATHRAGCDGESIGSQWILTAAHCVIDASGNTLAPKAFKVAVGADYSNWSGAFQPVDRVLRHPNFPAHLNQVPAWPADIAILHISTVPAFRYGWIPLSAIEPSVSTTVTMLGWGCAGPSLSDCGVPSTTLRQASTQVQSDAKCGFMGAYIPFDICTSRNGQSTIRHGDSGGPAFRQTSYGDYRLVGILSGFDSAKDYVTSISYTLAWVTKITGIGAPPSNAVVTHSPVDAQGNWSISWDGSNLDKPYFVGLRDVSTGSNYRGGAVVGPGQTFTLSSVAPGNSGLTVPPCPAVSTYQTYLQDPKTYIPGPNFSVKRPGC